MGDGRQEETAEHLLREGGKTRLPVTKARLHRWQQAGLLPKPRQRGLGRGRGSEVLYPAGSGRQLIALCRLLQDKRSLERACWGLWWEGYPVSGSRIRDLLSRRLAMMDVRLADVMVAVAAGSTEGEQDLRSRIEEWSRGPISDSLLRLTRRRTGKKQFSTFGLSIAQLSSGIQPELANDEAEIVGKGFGLADVEEMKSLFPWVAAALDPRAHREALASATLQDLEAARDEVRVLLDLVKEQSAFFESALGPGLAELVLSLLKRPSFEVVPHAVLLWLSVRRKPGAREVYAQALSALRAFIKGSVSLTEALQTRLSLREEDHNREVSSDE
jgi:hypothetical protein